MYISYPFLYFHLSFSYSRTIFFNTNHDSTAAIRGNLGYGGSFVDTANIKFMQYLCQKTNTVLLYGKMKDYCRTLHICFQAC